MNAEWKVEYENDDRGFLVELWTVSNGFYNYFCYDESAANWLAQTLNNMVKK